MMSDAYHSDYSSISKTMLAHFHRSPCEFDRYFVSRVEKPPQPKAVLIGAIAHDVLLMGRDLDDVACVYPREALKKNGAINYKPARAFEASLEPHQYAVKHKVRDQIASLLHGIKGHQVVDLVAKATAREQPIYWTDEASGLKCRCRPDFYHDMGSHIVCYDLKFTSQIIDFWRVARGVKYWMQDAHYSRGLNAEFNKPVQFVFWAVEDSAPFRVARYEYTQDSRENAAHEVARLLERMAECYKTGDWSDSWTHGTNDLLFTSSESTEVELDWSGI